jgi:hypothetical protein
MNKVLSTIILAPQAECTDQEDIAQLSKIGDLQLLLNCELPSAIYYTA